MSFHFTGIMLVACICICQVGSGRIGENRQLPAVNRLNSKVTVHDGAKPLSKLLSDISNKGPVDLRVARDLADQRFGIWIDNKSTVSLMECLHVALSHSSTPGSSLRWELAELTTKPSYTLRRIKNDDDQQTVPIQKLGKEIRDLCRLSRNPNQLAGYKGDLPRSYLLTEESKPFRDALLSLDEPGIEKLLRGERVPISPDLFPNQIRAFAAGWHAQETRRRETALSRGRPDPYPGGVPDAPPLPPALLLKVDNYDEEHPERNSLFGLYLTGASMVEGADQHIVFHPLLDGDPGPLSSEPDQTELDLSNEFQKAGASEAQRTDMAYLLGLISKVSHVNIVEEHFFKPVYWGARSHGITKTKGTVPDLLNAICSEWGYAAVKVGDTYVLWSRTWAFDRQADVSDSVINDLRKRIDKKGRYAIQVRSEIASEFTWPQLRLTLDALLPESGPWDRLQTVVALRAIQVLSKTGQTDVLIKPTEFRQLPQSVQSSILTNLFRPSDATEEQELRASLLSVTEATDRGLRLELVSATGQTLRSFTVHWNHANSQVSKQPH